MTDEVAKVRAKDSDEASLPAQAIVTAGDFRSVDYNSVLRNLNSAHNYHLQVAFINAMEENLGNEPTFSVYRLLAATCGLHFRLHDRAGSFGPQMIVNNRRTPIPDDWKGEQTEYFFEILEEIEHPALRARLADVVWTNDRRKSKAAALATLAYCECAQRLMDGTFEERFTTKNYVSPEEVDLVERASQIHLHSNKRSTPMHERVAILLETLYTHALEHGDIVPLKRIATLRSQYNLISMEQLAADMVAAARDANKHDCYPLAIKPLWDLAAFAYDEMKRPEDKRRCQLAGIEQTVSMGSKMRPAFAAAHWYRQAIGELRHVSDAEELRETLRKELRVLQEQALEEMGSFTVPIDLSDITIGTIKALEKLPVPEFLKQFALLARPRSAAYLRNESTEPETGIARFFDATYLDDEGKVIAEVEAATSDGSTRSEIWLKSKMAQNIMHMLHITVCGHLEPARRLLFELSPLSERHFEAIVQQSPFIPPGYEATFALGFARMMQGDMLSAGPILIPQLEQCLRYVLLNHSTDTSKIRNDLTQEDRSLSTLLSLYKGELTAIFGEDIVLYLDLIFIHRPGPALRHEFAHGKVGDRSYGDPIIFYACCFIYLLVCIPLFPTWSQQIAPAIEAHSF